MTPKQKTLIGVALGIMLLLVAILTFGIPKSTTPSTDTGKYVIPSDIPPTLILQANTTPIQTAIWYEQEDVRFALPASWKVESQSVSTGTSLTVRPAAADQPYPRLVITLEKGISDTTITTIQDNYQNYTFNTGRKQLQETFISAYDATIPYKLINGTVTNEDIQERIVLMRKENRLCTLLFQYEGSKPNPAYEQIFDTVLTSLRFL